SALLNQEIAGSLFPRQHKHRHRQGCLSKAGEILRILFERPKVLEAGAHAAPPGICFRVNPAVPLRHRMRRVGGEIVPEMLEVDAFATMYKRERRLTVKMEMPKIPHQPYVAPVSYPRQEGVHQHDPIHLARILRRIGVRNHQTDVVPYYPNVLITKFAHKSVNVSRHFGLGVSSGWGGRLTG